MVRSALSATALFLGAVLSPVMAEQPCISPDHFVQEPLPADHFMNVQSNDIAGLAVVDYPADSFLRTEFPKDSFLRTDMGTIRLPWCM